MYYMDYIVEAHYGKVFFLVLYCMEDGGYHSCIYICYITYV